MLSVVGQIFGEMLCLYYIAFRWNAVTAKYGTIDLFFWAYSIVIAWGLIGLLIELLAPLVIWGVQYGLWAASGG